MTKRDQFKLQLVFPFVLLLLFTGTPFVFGEWLGFQETKYTEPSTSGDVEFSITDDFNNDGIVDVALGIRVNRNQGMLDVMLGNVQSTDRHDVIFEIESSYNLPDVPSDVVLGDFNNDKKNDLAIANFDYLSVFLNEPNDQSLFSQPVNYSLNTSSDTTGITSGDFNNDSVLDIILVNEFQYVVFLGKQDTGKNGRDLFEEPVKYSLEESLWYNDAFDIISHDFNGDSILDLAISTQNFPTVNVLFGEGDGTFQMSERYYGMANGSENSFLGMGDFDGDGLQDIVLADGAKVNIFLALSNENAQPTGLFDEGFIPELMKDRYYIRALGANDLNKDGLSDLVISSTLGITIHTAREPVVGPGSFSPPLGYATPNITSKIVFEDLNGDQAQDIMVAISKSLISLYQEKTVPFSGELRFDGNPDYATSYGIDDMVIEDFDLDGQKEIVLADRVINQLIKLHDNSKEFRMITEERYLFTEGRPVSLIAEDFNNDGALDLAASNQDKMEISLFFGLLDSNGKPNGEFSNPQTYPTPVSPHKLLPGFFDDDVNLDIAMMDPTRDIICILYNSSSEDGNTVGDFSQFDQIQLSHDVLDFQTEDLDNDGDTDLAVDTATPITGTTLIYLNTPNGYAISSTLSESGYLQFLDINNDQLSDILKYDAFSKKMSIYVANEINNGTYSRNEQFDVNFPLFKFILKDVDNDNYLDVIAYEYEGNELNVYFGNYFAQPYFSSPTTISVGAKIVSMNASNYTNDYDLDLIVGNFRGSISLIDNLGSFFTEAWIVD